MLINVKDPSRMPIKFLWQLIFIFTFEKEKTGHMTKDVIGQQLMKWNEFIDINERRELEMYGLDPDTALIPIGKKGSVLDEMKYQLMLMCSWVVREEKGEFKPKVELYKKHKIDYHLAEPMCHVFPEHCRNRNMSKGLAALKKNMEDQPENYTNPDAKKRTFFTPN